MNPEGEVIEILEHSDKKYVGVLELSDSFAFVKVDSRKFPTDVFIPLRDLKGAKDGQKVLVRVTEWPDTMKNPAGEIVDVLGTPGDNNTEMHAILAEYDLPYTYPKEVEQEADKIPAELSADEIAARRDFPRHYDPHDRSRRRQGFRRCAFDAPSAQRQYRSGRAHRRCNLLRPSGRHHRCRGRKPRHIGISGGPDDPDAPRAPLERAVFTAAQRREILLFSRIRTQRRRPRYRTNGSAVR